MCIRDRAKRIGAKNAVISCLTSTTYKNDQPLIPTEAAGFFGDPPSIPTEKNATCPLYLPMKNSFCLIFKQLLTARPLYLSLIHISEPTRLGMISYAVFCLKKKTSS